MSSFVNAKLFQIEMTLPLEYIKMKLFYSLFKKIKLISPYSLQGSLNNFFLNFSAPCKHGAIPCGKLLFNNFRVLFETYLLCIYLI